jgi:hypothetical protein
MATTVSQATGRIRVSADLCFWTAGILLYGGAALNFAFGHFLDQSTRDLWQHLAALRALIEDIANPANPFLPGHEGSRHFHPQWVALAWLARLLGWNEWQAIGFAGFANAILLLVGIRAFARTFFRSDWAPLALLGAMVFGWSLPCSHTGYHSMGTLIEGIAYPAVLLIALSFLLWTLTIQALVAPRRAWLIAPLVAMMMATHQLGAGIGLIVASCFVLLWPGATITSRGKVVLGMAAGLILSLAWPYHSPFAAIARAGNPTWQGGIDYYSFQQIWIATVPAALGLIGLLQPRIRRRSAPIILALAIFTSLFLVGLFDVPIATRFIMPAVLMLHIGLAALFLHWATLPKAAQLGLFAVGVATLILFSISTFLYLSGERAVAAHFGNAYDQVQSLSRDIPDQEPIAAYDVAAWPLVAGGQRVYSVPWPEPMIDRLAEKQAAIEILFRPDLTKTERLRLAREMGVRTLMLDQRGPLRRPGRRVILTILERQSVSYRQAGPYHRYDLF